MNIPYYTVFAFSSVVITIIIDLSSRNPLLRTRQFMYFMSIVLLLTALFDNYVVYKGIYDFHPDMILNIRIPYAPIENLLYSFSFVTAQVLVFEKITNHK